MRVPAVTLASRRRRQQRGISLVEIMVALTLSLVLTAGAAQIYLSNKQTYRMQDAQSRIQENGRFALAALTHDLRQAGYVGCNSGSAPVGVIAKSPLVAPDVAPTAPAGVVRASPVTGGNDNSGGSFTSPNPATSVALDSLVQGTDAVTVQFAEYCGASTTAPMSTVDPSGLLSAGNSCNITVGAGTTAGTPMVVSNCESSHIFRAASDTSQNNNGSDTSALGKTYPLGSDVMRFRSYTYFTRMDSGQPALFRLDNNAATGGNNPAALVEGIENMQLAYGVDSTADGAADQYLAANLVSDWAQVVSVRITLTVRSIEDNLAATARTYNFNGVSVSDRRLIGVFTATVGLRNRLR